MAEISKELFLYFFGLRSHTFFKQSVDTEKKSVLLNGYEFMAS